MAKRFDRAYKNFQQEDLRGLLFLFWGLPLDDPAEIVAVDRELALPGKVVDDCYVITHFGRRYVLHLECEHHWHPLIPQDTAEYVMALALKFPRTPIFSNVILLTASGYPGENPSPYCAIQGDLETKVHFRVVKLWELDAEAALQLQRTSLLPWTLLMRPNPAQVDRASRQVADTKDEALAARFLTLGSLNPDYDKFKLLELLGRHGMLLKDEIVEQSDFIRYYQDKAQQRGLEEGLEQGRRDALVVFMHQLVAERFPGLEIPPAVAQGSLADLQRTLMRLVAAQDPAAAQAALDAPAE